MLRTTTTLTVAKAVTINSHTKGTEVLTNMLPLQLVVSSGAHLLTAEMAPQVEDLTTMDALRLRNLPRTSQVSVPTTLLGALMIPLVVTLVTRANPPTPPNKVIRRVPPMI